MNDKRELLRHALATIAYRGGKALRDAPPTFATFAVSPSSRTPAEILAHVGDLFEWALSMCEGAQRWSKSTPLEWDREVDRFFETLERFDACLASDAAMAISPEQLIQGPVGDALTHIGQLAFLRRVAGAPLRGESYFQADVVVGRVGAVQSPPRREI